MNSSIFLPRMVWVGSCILALTISWIGRAAEGPVLTYDETSETVSVTWQGQEVVHTYQAERNGFVNASGDWVAWDAEAGNWLYIARKGNQARFSSEGVFLGIARPPEGAAGVTAEAGAVPGPVAIPAFDPRNDVTDAGTSRKSGPNSSALAVHYLQEANLQDAQRPKAVVGEDFGLPLQQGSVGADVSGRERQLRDAWKKREGAHQRDPAAAMETGAVENPIDKLASTISNIQGTLIGIGNTVEGVKDIKEMFDDSDRILDGKKSPAGVSDVVSRAGAVQRTGGTVPAAEGTASPGHPAAGNGVVATGKAPPLIKGDRIPYTPPPSSAHPGKKSPETLVESPGSREVEVPAIVKPQTISDTFGRPDANVLIKPNQGSLYGKPPVVKPGEAMRAVPSPGVYKDPGLKQLPPRDVSPVYRDPGLKALPDPRQPAVYQDPGLKQLPPPAQK